MAAPAHWKGRESWGFLAFGLLFSFVKSRCYLTIFFSFWLMGSILRLMDAENSKGPSENISFHSFIFQISSKPNRASSLSKVAEPVNHSLYWNQILSLTPGLWSVAMPHENSFYPSPTSFCWAYDFFSQNHFQLVKEKNCFLFTAACQECTSSVGLKELSISQTCRNGVGEGAGRLNVLLYFFWLALAQ